MTVEERIFAKYVGRPILLDSNLLLLLLVGGFQPALIANFKRTAKYSIRDFETLLGFLGSFSGIVTTPHVLTEVSNLANSLPEWRKPAWGEFFGAEIQLMHEVHRNSAELARDPAFLAYGLTDTALEQLSAGTLLLTDDRRLSGYLRSLSLNALNFDDLLQIKQALAN
jgi:hypothetical protein